MAIPNFFETDHDEFAFGGKVYCDYFNLYPELHFDGALEHLRGLVEVTVLDSSQTSDGWQIAVRYGDVHFLVDTHFHGTSTLFCAEQGTTDETVMLAFLGLFLPVIRDNWISSTGKKP